MYTDTTVYIFTRCIKQVILCTQQGGYVKYMVSNTGDSPLTSSTVVLGLQMSTSSKLGRGRASSSIKRARTVLRTLST